MSSAAVSLLTIIAQTIFSLSHFRGGTLGASKHIKQKKKWVMLRSVCACSPGERRTFQGQEQYEYPLTSTHTWGVRALPPCLFSPLSTHTCTEVVHVGVSLQGKLKIKCQVSLSHQRLFFTRWQTSTKNVPAKKKNGLSVLFFVVKTVFLCLEF